MILYIYNDREIDDEKVNYIPFIKRAGDGVSLVKIYNEKHSE
ncbi:hypothetical protein MPAN_017640 [Mariniplasma anaerobium]|uniref:Uncharacterized protein n=1 Tax=Mariniplasma anaerobium TaxID=2735436 RepID=A0A7U9XV42_9MOLU|nr:hypothetical protein MPAN_017640 [Mariniplasma anaerobium]